MSFTVEKSYRNIYYIGLPLFIDNPISDSASHLGPYAEGVLG